METATLPTEQESITPPQANEVIDSFIINKPVFTNTGGMVSLNAIDDSSNSQKDIRSIV